VGRRLAAPGLAGVAVVAALAGAGGLASILLLAAIVAASVRLLDAVGTAAVGRSDRFPVVTSVAAVVCLVVASATHLPMLALGAIACIGLELLGDLEVGSDLAVEPD
jgi:hypothetical protein